MWPSAWLDIPIRNFRLYACRQVLMGYNLGSTQAFQLLFH
jgi:hypothetical protein